MKKPKIGQVFKKYLLSYIGISMAVCILGGWLFIQTYTKEIEDRSRQDYERRFTRAYEGLDNIFHITDNIAASISSTSCYLPNYTDHGISYELERVKDLGKFVNYLPFEYDYALYYVTQGSVYTGKTKYAPDVYFNYVICEGETTRKEIEECTTRSVFIPDDQVAYLVYPIISLRRDARFIIRMPISEITSYLGSISSFDKENITISCEDNLVKEALETVAYQMYCSELVYLFVDCRDEYAQIAGVRMKGLQILFWISLGACLFSISLTRINYRPIKRIIQRHDLDYITGDNELALLDESLSRLIEKENMSMKMLDEMSIQIERQKRTLIQQKLKLVIRGDEAAADTIPLRKALYALLTIKNINRDIDELMQFIEECGSPEECLVYAMPENEDNLINVLLNANEKDSVFSIIDTIASVIEPCELVFIGICNQIKEIPGLIEHHKNEKYQDQEADVSDLFIEQSGQIICDIKEGRSAEAIMHLHEFENMLSVIHCGASGIRGIRAQLLGRIHAIALKKHISLPVDWFSSLLSHAGAEEFIETLSPAIISIAKTAQKQSSEVRNEQAQRLKTYIKAHLCEMDLSLAKVSDETNLSSRTISRVLEEVEGCSYLDFVRLLRLEHAVELLRNNNLSVSSIANEVGYTNVSYFIRVFKEQYGFTPAVYRSVNSEDCGGEDK